MPRPPTPAKPNFNWRLWLRVVAWSGVFAGVALGAKGVHSFLLQDSRFDLGETVELHGAVNTSTARVQSVFAADFGRSIFDAPLAERRRHLLAIDWVRTASVTRLWPNRIVVTITERTPVAFAKMPVAGSARRWMALIDQDGVLLTLPARSHFHLPVLSGLSEEQTDEERRSRVRAMQRLLTALGSKSADVSEVNAASPQDMRVIAAVDGHGVELWIGDQNYLSRYTNFVNHYPAIRAHSAQASVFDLRFDDRILAR